MVKAERLKVPAIITGTVFAAFSVWIHIATQLGLPPVLETGVAFGGPAIALSLTHACRYIAGLWRS